jgi:CRISPR-associated protein Csm2
MTNIIQMSPEEIVREAENVAIQLATKDKVKTGQIRNFYAGITRMRTDFLSGNSEKVHFQLVMLKPKLAYAAGRQLAVKTTFYPKMKDAVDGVLNASNQDEALKKFFMYVESIVAYHKFYGGE